MSYELINKDLNIWSCSISDLTIEEVNCFLSQWGKEDKISSLTIFHVPTDDKLVINRDTKAFNTYVKLTQNYLIFDDEERAAYKKALSEEEFEKVEARTTISEFISVLDSAILSRKMKNLINVLGKQPCRLDKIKEFKYLINNSDVKDIYWVMVEIYSYGYIEGIRAERTRRKASTKKVGAIV